ncbi:membrane fusion protein (multidrug efflux system) [Caulobacter ginsengisoli]|uniref:Membrane fusion protein (Multidrug efflux system) n=1 Tax=Caulobacter ginsengisoli TaxID=400775 RepID=A0ABU0IXP5_9CAUL|nr:HlyD family efflux transporter periplasmic adaptor subunit [Caulobacter ginsengisoli]MDQ0466779.1 membrane fusion protein (multidrug efflux system) [Caulobacter ginsengisoli]
MANETSAPPAGGNPANPKNGQRRNRLLTLLGVAVLLGGIVYFFYWLLVSSHHVSTDNAYVGASTAQVTPLVSGAIISAPVGDTRFVHKGDVLVVLDPTDYRIALASAEAALGQAERRVNQYAANTAAAAATTAARGADVSSAQAKVQSAQADVDKARAELGRRQNLAGTGAISGEELTTAKSALTNAQAALDGARATLAQARAQQAAASGQQQSAAALIAGTSLADNPEVAAARARVAQARLDLERTVIRAPVDGVIAKNTIEVGQRVQVGAALMSVVPIQTAYVDANFKEVQLRKVRIGQPVVLTSDLYGGGVKFHGKVVGLAGGTGSSFALIPAQNATGNWVKVVQRIPVRVSLDPKELAAHPLRVGLSMKADIDVTR